MGEGKASSVQIFLIQIGNWPIYNVLKYYGIGSKNESTQFYGIDRKADNNDNNCIRRSISMKRIEECLWLLFISSKYIFA